jgi:hypothetical protein
MRKNETFGSIKVYTMTTNNQPINSILQISNFSGHAQFTRDMACTSIDVTRATSQTGSMTNIVGTNMDISGISVNSYVVLSDVSGILQAPYMNMATSANKGVYLYESRGFLELQNTSGRIISGDPIDTRTIDTVTNISGWQQILTPTDSVTTATSDLSGLITSVNELLRVYANKRIILTTGPTSATITGITVDISGFYVSWTPTTRALSIDGLVYDSSANSPYFIPIATTNPFYYSLTVGSSLPFLAAFCTINSNPTDLSNFYPPYGLSPVSRAYYRATSPGVNYIILSTVSTTLPANAVFFMQGSNASPTRPISFIYYNRTVYGSSYVSTSFTVSDSHPHVLLYNAGLGLWILDP